MAGSGPLVARLSAAAGVAGAAVSAGAQFLVVIVVTRTLAPREAGEFFAATALILMVGGILRLDAGNGVIYFLARGRDPFLAALAPSFALSLLAAVPLGLAVGSPVAGALLPFVVVADVLLAASRAGGSMRLTFALDGVGRPVAQLALVTLTAGSVAAWAAPALPVAVVAAAVALRKPDERVGFGEFWTYAGPRAGAAAVQAVFQRLDVVIVAMLAGPAPAAVYTAATRFKVVGQLINQGLAQAVQPRLVRALADGDLGKARDLYRSSTRWLVLLTWPIWIGYAALAPWLLDAFGPAYAHGLPVTFVLAATMLVATACGMVDVVLIASGRTASSLANTVAAVAVSVVVDLVLVPRLGATGAALGWSAGVLVKNLLPLIQLTRRDGLWAEAAR
ncbi:polysaccharide biosynthesis C-terminal domain-containing protein [Streptosporangiaceae bacterium NEAU-GS5]|nr:polysaccharide biosynthesis C-terminal domain-containing protein [Streptosporangiaceae bacterium NEAU-GS5]